MQNDKIIRSNIKPLEIVNEQIKISNDLLAEHDIFNEFYRLQNIYEAINLAISSRKFTDPFYDKNEFKDISCNFIAEQVLERIYSNNFQQTTTYEIKVPKNRLEERYAEYYDLPSYSLRFLISLILYKRIKINENVFGGTHEIFTIREREEDPYLKTNENFWSWQKKIINSQEFQWVYIADVKQYYSTISTSILSELITTEFNITSPKFLAAFNQCFKSLTIGSMCDHFIQNIYLTQLDRHLGSISYIKYSRLTDDIRIFCKDEVDAEEIHQQVLKEITRLKLAINNDKQFIIKPIKYIDREPKSRSFYTDYHNFMYDSSQKEKFSHYIKLTDIDKFDFENILQLTYGTYDSFGWCNPKYDIKRLPRKLTLKDIIDGKSGFKLGSIDLNYFLSGLETNTKNQPSLDDFDKLGQVINHATGTYRFYSRTIRLYFNLLLTITDQNVLCTVWEKLISCIPKRDYNEYIFWRVLFSRTEIDELTYYQHLAHQERICNDLKELVWNIFNSTSTNGFLFSEIHYLITNGYLDNLTTETGEIFWKSESFWGKKLRLIDNNPHAYKYTKTRLLEIILELLPSSIKLRTLYIDNLINVKFYDDAYEELIKLKNEGHNVSLFHLAYCCAAIDLNDEAINYYTEFLKTNASSGAFNNRGLLFQEMEKYEEALQDYSRAINLDNDEIYYFNRGALYYNLGNYNEALSDFVNAYNQNRKPNFLLKQAESLLALGKFSEAKVTYYKFYEESPDKSGMGPVEKCWMKFQDKQK